MRLDVDRLWREAGRRDVVVLGVGFCLVLLGLIDIGLAWTPSHFALALNQLGFGPAGLVFGTAQEIRTDDFLVATALIRNVVENGFAPVDAVSPYHEPFRSFVASPIHDWSLAFKPQFWGFLVFGPARALSFYFAFFYGSFVLGYTLLLRRLGVPSRFGLAVTFMLLFSQLVQVWWTQRAPVYAFAPWPLLIFLSGMRLRYRLPALVYATAVWLFGEFYPPAIIGTVFAWAVLTLAFSRSDLTSRDGQMRCGLGLLAILLGIGVVAFYFADLIPVMQATIYPGQRVASGGGVPWQMLLAHLFPYAATLGFLPVVVDYNACEIGVVGTFLPLMLLVFGDYGSLRIWFSRHRRAAVVWPLGLGLMLAWLSLPLPAEFGMLFLWTYVPPHRLLWGFGVLLTIGCAIIAAEVPWRLGPARLAVFILVILAGFGWSKGMAIEPGSAAAEGWAALRWMSAKLWDVAILVPVLAVAVLHRLWPHPLASRLRLALTLSAVAAALVTFGRFNPIQSAKPIFTQGTTPFLDAARALARANPKGWAAVPGLYGGLLNAFGVPAINHVLLEPDLPFFRILYPDMPAEHFDGIFNRYAHIEVDFGHEPSVPVDDVVRLPVFDVGTPLPVTRDASVPVEATIGGHIDVIEPTHLDGPHWRLVVQGWAPFKGIEPAQKLLLGLSRGRIVEARAARVIGLDVGTALQDHAYDTARFALEIDVDLPDEQQSFADDALDIGATDEAGIVYRLPQN